MGFENGQEKRNLNTKKILLEELLRDILDNPKYRFPLDIGELTAIIIALATHIRKASENDQIAFLRILARRDLTSEYSVLGAQLAFTRTQLTSLLKSVQARDPQRYVGNAGNVGQHFYARKFSADFTIEITRSVKKAIQAWTASNSYSLKSSPTDMPR